MFVGKMLDGSDAATSKTQLILSKSVDSRELINSGCQKFMKSLDGLFGVGETLGDKFAISWSVRWFFVFKVRAEHDCSPPVAADMGSGFC